MNGSAKRHSFGFHLFDAAIDDVLFQLEIGNAVAQKAADAIVAFENGDVVSHARELCAAARPAGPEPTTATRLPVLARAITGATRFCSKARSAMPALDVLDGHRLFVDIEHARRLAGRRAHAPGHFGKVVGRVERGRGLVEAVPWKGDRSNRE